MKPSVKILLLVVGVLGIAGIVGYMKRDILVTWFFAPTKTTVQQGVMAEGEQVVAQDLTVPWEVAFLPSGDYLVTERPGTIKRIGENRQTYRISGVQHVGEGGLLGLALHPQFVANNYLYVYLTSVKGTGLINRVERYTLQGDSLTDRQVILADIPGERNHDGGRLAFGPDGKLYITVGDAGNEQSAQDTAALSGKILRINDDGTVPADNPFGNAVYSYGHRNPQGLAWDDTGQLWATEHGRSGVNSTGYDELNRITKGGNYGWPLIEGDEARSGMIKPVAHSGPDETWAPASLAFWDGALFFGGLRGQSLYEARLLDGGRAVSLKAHLSKQYGRLRAVALDAEDRLYITTSNQDGRGTPSTGDDKLIRIDPRTFR